MAITWESDRRSPLMESTNSSGTRRHSEPLEPLSKTLRRSSASTSCLYDSSDSSRAWLSEDSIFPAPVCSISEKLDELPKTQTIVAGGASFEMLAAPTGIESDLVTSVHYPHTLDPIIEQRSASSLRNSPQLSLKQKASIVSKLSLRRSSHLLRQLADTRRKASFSLTDLTLFKTLANFLDTPNSSQASLDQLPRLQPTMPAQPALQRRSTPPDLPSFNTREAHVYRLPRPAKSMPRLPRPHQLHQHSPRALGKMLRERLAAHRALGEWRQQTTDLPRGAVMRGDDGTLVYGGWHPLQSGHTGHVSPPPPPPSQRRGRTAGPVKAVGTGTSTQTSIADLLRQYGLTSTSSPPMPPPPRLSRGGPATLELAHIPRRRSSREMRPPTPMPMPMTVSAPVPVPVSLQPMPGGLGTHRGMAVPVQTPVPARAQPTSSGRTSATGRTRMPLTLFCCCWTLGGEAVAGRESSEF